MSEVFGPAIDREAVALLKSDPAEYFRRTRNQPEPVSYPGGVQWAIKHNYRRESDTGRVVPPRSGDYLGANRGC